MSSDILKKNFRAELHKKHSRKIIGEKLESIPSFENIWS